MPEDEDPQVTNDADAQPEGDGATPAQQPAEETDDAASAAIRGAQEALEILESAGTSSDEADGTPSMEFPTIDAVAEIAQRQDIDLLGDVGLDVKIELGRTRMLVEDVLRLGEGAVVELDKLAGDPVDVYVNGRLVARGEVLVLSDNFCVRINEIVKLGDEARKADSDEGDGLAKAG